MLLSYSTAITTYLGHGDDGCQVGELLQQLKHLIHTTITTITQGQWAAGDTIQSAAREALHQYCSSTPVQSEGRGRGEMLATIKEAH